MFFAKYIYFIKESFFSEHFFTVTLYVLLSRLTVYIWRILYVIIFGAVHLRYRAVYCEFAN